MGILAKIIKLLMIYTPTPDKNTTNKLKNQKIPSRKLTYRQKLEKLNNIFFDIDQKILYDLTKDHKDKSINELCDIVKKGLE